VTLKLNARIDFAMLNI